MKDSEMIVLKFLSKLAAVRARYIEHQAIRESQKRANELLYLKTSAVKLARSRFVVPSEKRRYSQFSAARHDRPIDRQLVEPRSEQPGGINASEISYSNQLEKGISKIHRLTNPSDINTILHHVPERRRSLHDLLN